MPFGSYSVVDGDDNFIKLDDSFVSRFSAKERERERERKKKKGNGISTCARVSRRIDPYRFANSHVIEFSRD